MAGSSLSTPRTDTSSCTRKDVLVLSYRTDTHTHTGVVGSQPHCRGLPEFTLTRRIHKELAAYVWQL